MKKKRLQLFLMLMKFSIYGMVMQILLVTGIFAHDSEAQKIQSVKEYKLRLNLENEDLNEIFKAIENKTDFTFHYDRKLINNNIRATLKGNNRSLYDYLIDLSQQTQLKFKQLNTFISVSKAEPKEKAEIEIILQTRTITGKVTAMDEEGGLPGVNVLEKGSSNGTVTDLQGEYSLEVSEGATLVFSSVGYTTEEVEVGGRSVIDLTMAQDIQQLQVLVVVGYGTQKEREVSGAITTIDAKQIEKTPSPNFEQALQGVSPGVQVTSTDGSPEGASRILIRGTNSITAGTEPLIILDGNPISFGGTTFLSQINPNDIKSITVLRDASASAIYGSRGANGVILVTTKTGKSGQSELNFNFETGVMQPINNIKPARPDEWREAYTTAYRNRFGDATDEEISDQLAAQFAGNLFNPFDQDRFLSENIFGRVNNYWYDQVISDGSYQQYGVSASRGTENTSYYFSGQYRSQDGSFIGEHYDRYQFRANLDFNPTDYMKMGIKYNVSFQDIDLRNKGNRTFQNASEGRLNFGAFSDYDELFGGSLPIFPVYWPNSTEPFDPYSGFNIIHSNSGNTVNNSQVLNNVGNIYLNIEPIKNLIISGDLGINYNLINDKSWVSDRARYFGATEIGDVNIPLDSAIRYTGQNRIDQSNRRFLSMNYLGTVAYSFNLMEDHNFSALAGVEVLNTNLFRHNYAVQGFPVFFQDQEDVYTRITENEASDKMLILDDIKGPNERLFSRFFRLNYDYKSKYFLQVVIRRDGSSKFSPRNRYSNFPSVSAGWIASDEAFFNFEPINYLKLKSSWGITGNNAIGNFQFFNQYQTWPQYGDQQAFLLTRLGSGRIQWETSTTFDVGLDFGLFDNRLRGSFTYFNTKTDDMLLDVRLAPSLGVYSGNPFATSNVGSIRNQGFEIELNSINVESGDFQWTSSFNITSVNNRVLKLSEGVFDQFPSRYAGGSNTAVIPDEPIGTFFLPEFAGYDEDGFPLVKVIDQDLAEDEYQYVFLQNEAGMDSVTRATDNAVNQNRVLQRGKTGLPTLFGGLTNTLTYKGISLSVLMTFQAGNYIYDGVGGTNAGGLGAWFREGITDNTWTPENTNADFRRLYFGGIDNNGDPISNTSTNNLKRGDFMRLRNISLSYDLPTSLMEKTFIGGVRVYMNLTNVATISSFNRFDPEVLSNGGATDRNTSQGVVGDVPYFQFFTATGGINVRF